MKKILIALFLIAGGVAYWTLAPPAETDAAPCIRCLNFTYETPVAEGRHKTSCTAAINDAIANAMALIPGSCDVCETTPIEVTPCHFVDDWDWIAEYKIRYRCSVDLCN